MIISQIKCTNISALDHYELEVNNISPIRNNSTLLLHSEDFIQIALLLLHLPWYWNDCNLRGTSSSSSANQR
jgi:hypothetical protein